MSWATLGPICFAGTILMALATPASGQFASANPLIRANAPDDFTEQHPAASLFGYKRNISRTVRGDEVTYSRARSNGTQSVLTPAQFDPLARQITLLVNENPWTTRAWRNCPQLVDFVASKLEGGAEYAGGQDGESNHPHAWGHRFWSQEPDFPGARDQLGNVQPWGDPVDGTVYFLMELLNASRASEFQQIWTQSRDAHRQLVAQVADPVAKKKSWEQNRERWIYSEAGLKAENLAWAVQIVRENAQGLSVTSNTEAGYGRAFQQYARWVDATTQQNGSVDYGKLSDTILANRSTFRLNPPDQAETYGSRLARVYQQYMPLK